MSDQFADLKREVAIANRILADHGVVDALGHISARSPADPTHFFISRSLAPELVTADDIQEFDLNCVDVNADTRPPYAERAIHAGIYAARPDVLAVCHNHAPSVIPFGITDLPLRPVFHMAATIAGAGVREVVFTCIYLQLNAHLQLQTLSSGREPRYLSSGEIERTAATLLQPLTQERTWTAWSHRITLPAD